MSLGDNENTTATVDIKALETALEIETAHEADSAAERHVIRKIDTYLLPMLSFMLLVAFLDRTNIGNAKIQGMTTDLNMKGTDYNIALFLFFIPYMSRTRRRYPIRLSAKIGHCPRSHIYSRSPHHSLVLVPRVSYFRQ